MYRVVFPFELKLRNTSEDCENVDDTYHLFAVVVHVGSGPNHGILFSLLLEVAEIILSPYPPILPFLSFRLSPDSCVKNVSCAISFYGRHWRGCQNYDSL